MAGISLPGERYDIISLMKNKKIIIANWKMNPASLKEAEKIASGIAKGLKNTKKTDVVICPPFLYLEKVKKVSKNIIIGAQNTHFETTGAFTGEVSAEMLSGVGVKYVILGHSERRAEGDTNEIVNKKIKSAFASHIIPIVCVGEKVRDENHKYLHFIKTQIEECFDGISKNLISKIVIAYEPIWAIGKDATREATAEEFLEMSIFIKKILSDKFSAKIVEEISIVYGGSVHPENCFEFLQKGNTAGFLVGRDSLEPKKFLEILKITEYS